MFREPRDVAGVGLEVAAGAVQEHQFGPGAARRTRVRTPPAVSAPPLAQLVVDVGKLAPDAHVAGFDGPAEVAGLGEVYRPSVPWSSWAGAAGNADGPGPRPWWPPRRSAAAARRAGRAAGSSRWSGTRPAPRPSRCGGGARSTAACRRNRRWSRTPSRPRPRCGRSRRSRSARSRGGGAACPSSGPAEWSGGRSRTSGSAACRRWTAWSGCAPGRRAAAPTRRRAPQRAQGSGRTVSLRAGQEVRHRETAIRSSPSCRRRP